MFENCIKKQNAIKELFEKIPTEELRCQKLIELGKTLPRLAPSERVPEYLINDCQSTIYLKSNFSNGTMQFQADADALVALGLAALLISVYNEESPKTIIECAPSCLDDVGVWTNLSSNLTEPLQSIYLHMKQDALKHTEENPR